MSGMEAEGGKREQRKRRREDRKAFSKQERKRKRVQARDAAPPDLLPDAHTAQYYFSSGLRCVRPHYFTFKAYAKLRWLGRTLQDVLSDEFAAYSHKYYADAVQAARIRVNGQAVSGAEYIFRDSDLMEHLVHRHEPPVPGQNIEVTSVQGDVIVIDKPAGIPVHPCGKYYFNSVVYILANQDPPYKLRSLHRLDRLTSGLLMLSSLSATADDIGKSIRDREAMKFYVARVRGCFPAELAKGESESWYELDKVKKNVFSLLDDDSRVVSPVVVADPIYCVSQKLGKHAVPKSGDASAQAASKPCKSVFRRLHFDSSSNTSVVVARLFTGRTHQLRVHLQHIGFPIANDPWYGGVLTKPNLLPNDVPDETLEKDAVCWECNGPAREYQTCKEIWLHSLQFCIPDKDLEFVVNLPVWASADFDAKTYLSEEVVFVSESSDD